MSQDEREDERDPERNSARSSSLTHHLQTLLIQPIRSFYSPSSSLSLTYSAIQALKAENVQYVVAPYEADAQLAYLEKEGIVDGIITEDSDLMVFGCKSVSNFQAAVLPRRRFIGPRV